MAQFVVKITGTCLLRAYGTPTPRRCQAGISRFCQLCAGFAQTPASSGSRALASGPAGRLARGLAVDEERANGLASDAKSMGNRRENMTNSNHQNEKRLRNVSSMFPQSFLYVSSMFPPNFLLISPPNRCTVRTVVLEQANGLYPPPPAHATMFVLWSEKLYSEKDQTQQCVPSAKKKQVSQPAYHRHLAFVSGSP